ncbi:hypothetical protein EMWEY_00035530 [Eimeria maxima]|uniref:Uncharacterized protein n=1 Tax=Eimeria maxima TaxID=5804 RepID=U6M9Z6_EIMMA|nr:hypothetical protein EMWEY_00035530 [Eimeria maxima]CDJ60861.1 hypothetical protein EMWEY_00035530 [Eimeria maxima]
MGPLQPVVKAPLDPEVGCPCCFSEEEDAAERALRFHVRTQKQQLQHEEGGGSRRLQQVVDKPVVWGPKVMPLASILGATQQADSSENHKDKRHRTDIQGARDSFEVKCILSTDECQRLVEAAEAQGFEYWAKETASAPGRTFAQNDNEYHRSIGGHRSSSSSTSSRSVGSSESQRANHNYRSAHTVEVEHPDLADLIWQRVKEYVIREVSFSEEDGERFERDLEGTWEACGVNSTLLFARYILKQTKDKQAQITGL